MKEKHSVVDRFATATDTAIMILMAISNLALSQEMK